MLPSEPVLIKDAGDVLRVHLEDKEGAKVMLTEMMEQATMIDDDKPDSTGPLSSAPEYFPAFDGLAGDFIRLVGPTSEADPMAVLVQLLVTFGSAIGKAAHFLAEATAHYANESVVVVGGSSKARKGTSLGHVRRMMRLIDPAWDAECVVENLTSGEGLVERVGHAAVANQAVEPRLLAVLGEFASVLHMMRRQGNSLSSVLRVAWDGSPLQILTKNAPCRVDNAHVSVIGHITGRELKRCLDSVEIANGFGNRIMWVYANRSKYLPFGGRYDLTESAPLAVRFRAALAFGKAQGVMAMDAAARDLWKGVYRKLTSERDDDVGMLLGRAEAHVMRLSMIYAVLDRSPEIRFKHLISALAVQAYAKASCQHIFGETRTNSTTSRLTTALKNSENGLSRTQIRDLFSKHKAEHEVTSALSDLVGRGLAHSMQIATGGRPMTVYRNGPPLGQA